MRKIAEITYQLTPMTGMDQKKIYALDNGKDLFFLCRHVHFFWKSLTSTVAGMSAVYETVEDAIKKGTEIKVPGGSGFTNIFEFDSLHEFLPWADETLKKRNLSLAEETIITEEPITVPAQAEKTGKKVALLCYHKNLNTIYPSAWIEKYRQSVLSQTFQEFQIFELNYGGGPDRIFENSVFEVCEYPTFVHALQWLLDTVFSAGYEFAFNSNVDDYMDATWMERLLKDAAAGHDLVSSNFCLVRDDQIVEYHKFHHMDIRAELAKDNNIICHPSVCYSKKFWERHRYNADEMPVEDLRLWQRAIQNGSHLFINENNLLFHRLHNLSVTQSANK